jgi:hypothetical protein
LSIEIENDRFDLEMSQRFVKSILRRQTMLRLCAGTAGLLLTPSYALAMSNSDKKDLVVALWVVFLSGGLDWRLLHMLPSVEGDLEAEEEDLHMDRRAYR